MFTLNPNSWCFAKISLNKNICFLSDLQRLPQLNSFHCSSNRFNAAPTAIGTIHSQFPPNTDTENTGNPLKSQPLSPTKLKVTRQSQAAQQKQPEQVKPEPVEEEVCLRWNSHHSNMQTAFPALLQKEQYVDVTLIAEGKTLKCHKVIFKFPVMWLLLWSFSCCFS